MRFAGTRPYHRDPRHGTFAVTLQEVAKNRKLAPLEGEPYFSETLNRMMTRPTPGRTVCSSTYVSIEATCPDDCRFKAAGCYVRAGFTGRAARKLDRIAESAGLSGLSVALQEARLMDEAFSGGEVPQDGGRDGTRGRDLRLHVGGDFADATSAAVLAWAARRWRARGGGAVWAYTHRWREIGARLFHPHLAVLASVESGQDAAEAIRAGYVPALVVDTFHGKRAQRVPGLPRGWKVIPCPAERGARTCVECRLCFDTEKLMGRKRAIGFELHGAQRNKVHLPMARQGRLEGVV